MLISHFESLPGFIPFAILWHTGGILNKNVNKSKNYSYLTATYASILYIVCISGILYIIFILAMKEL